MEKYDVKFKKKLGQNFLKDSNIVKRIVDISNIDKNSLVIEVGPGGAIMTKELALKAKNVLAYEIDSDLASEIERKLEGYDNIDVIFQDFLDSDLVTDISHYSFKHLYFVSNVPYYITTPIILKLIKSKLYFDNIVMMVQKEVGDRFSTSPGSREYGSITVLLNYFYHVKKEFLVSRKQFVPEPNVDSMIISFTEREDKYPLKDFAFFEQILHDSFQFIRKNIRNNLKKYDLSIIEEVLSNYGFDLNVRAEMLDVKVFVDISNALLK
jgi:16S rRNA (adenine1518-N6/adenine1519-N6)-dimethyltransferase